MNKTGTNRSDRIVGTSSADKIWSNLGNDTINGGAGDDLVVGGFGADRMLGGFGNDVLLSRSDAGEPIPAQGGPRQHDVFFNITFDPFKMPHNDVLRGGAGADTFKFESFINTRPQQALLQLHPDGDTNWMSIAMTKNGSVARPAIHYHWSDGIGVDTITDYNKAEGDRISLQGHTLDVKSITYRGADTVIDLVSYSTTPGPKAHQGDDLGDIIVKNARVTSADIAIDKRPVFGAFNNVNDVGGPLGLRSQPFQTDDTGVLPGMGFPGEQPWMM
jgi:Ca2+-binding RTX toxin-like protein